MTNDPYRDDPYGLGGSRSTGGGTSEPPPPDAAWRPPSDPTAPDPPPTSDPPPTGPPPPAGETPGPSAYSSPQYQAEQYQPQQYQPPPYQGQPYQGQPYPGPYQAQPMPGQPYLGAPRRTNGLAIAALVCSLAGVITVISAPVGAVLGHLSARQITQTGEEGAQLARAAIWVGWIVTGLYLAACCALLALAITASRTSPAFAPR